MKVFKTVAVGRIRRGGVVCDGLATSRECGLAVRDMSSLGDTQQWNRRSDTVLFPRYGP
ncbi:hypothetical protein SAMN05192561_10838 [Halopenitus malekzadehii]|uniref:Uncharacterized protein n=1 Tax=Halopenitus malekzadehii TaxID=1267564 RepID=A0A1H6JE26_9EURY|nr:hypothetical protein SAMN05192561_10838 [Halopenitus malekzadehii]